MLKYSTTDYCTISKMLLKDQTHSFFNDYLKLGQWTIIINDAGQLQIILRRSFSCHHPMLDVADLYHFILAGDFAILEGELRV